ncbi:MAG: phage-related regulatory protein [Saprospiraceae bacterium]|nr:MAG: phage-related regulatory protein [Saprospiraceae bacterium]
MDYRVITFFNNKGGVGKTTTVYHIAWMMANLGHKVLAVDLDPQSNLSSMFLPPERMEEVIFSEEGHYTILDSIVPVSEGEPYRKVHLEEISENIDLIIGNLSLSAFEDKLSDVWSKCLAEDVFAFKITSLFKTVFDDAVARSGAHWVLVDVGPNLGAINRAVMVSTHFVIIPVATDMFSLQGIKNLGTTLRKWRIDWQQRLDIFGNKLGKDVSLLPKGYMQPLGYILMQYISRSNRPVKSYLRWAERIPEVYARYVLGKDLTIPLTVQQDPNCLALLKHYHSLAPLSMEARKPIFLLKPADGAIGSHLDAVRKAEQDFEQLTKKIMEVSERTPLILPKEKVL